jgi:hypothetical protein
LVEVMPVAVYVCQRYCGSLRLYSPDGKWMRHRDSKMAEVLRTGVEARDLEVVIERPDGSRTMDPDLARRFVFITGDTLGATVRDFLDGAGRPTLTKPFDLTRSSA